MELRNIFCPAISRIYNESILEEARLANKNDWLLQSADKMWRICEELFDTIEACSVVKQSERKAGWTREFLANGISEGSHAYLVGAIVSKIFSCQYGPKANHVTDGFTYSEIMETIWSPRSLKNLVDNIEDYEYYEVSKAQWLLYLASRVADILVYLYRDITEDGFAQPQDLGMTKYERSLYKLCDNRMGFVSEKRTVEFLKIKRLSFFDDTGIFTQIIIMATLQSRGVWYDWREKEYSE